MNVAITIGNIVPPQRVYLTWAPQKATARVVNGPAGGPVAVTLRNSGTGGQVVLGLTAATATQDTLAVTLPADGTPVAFFAAGKFGSPSSSDLDVTIQAVDNNAAALGSLAAMVRIRKNANALAAAERDRFLSALGTLNDRGMGKFSDFRNMHDAFAYYEAHANSGFLAWHRAYLLDLERALQSIDASVALPYWKFDQLAPNLFATAFLGVPDNSGTVQFTPGHPLQSWSTDNTPGISRSKAFIKSIPGIVKTEAQTLAIGTDFQSFQDIENNPHNNVHGSFRGFLSDPTIAPRDPLFFLLHANVDRLWAKWQWLQKLFDPVNANAYTTPDPPRIGHNLNDTMWPWNGITGDGGQPTATGDNRPPTAPGGPFPASPNVASPPPAPRVRDMLDFQGAATAADVMGFDYDDVPFEA